MPINVLELIRSARKTHSNNLEQLAQRLAGGDKVPAAEVLRLLHDCGGTADDLQTEIDRLERVERLRSDVLEGDPARVELQKLNAILDAASEKARKARAAADDLTAKHAARHMELRHTIERADRAADRLLEPANLSPGDRAALDDANAAHDRAAKAHSEARRELDSARERMARGQQLLDAARKTASEHPSWAPYRDDLAAAEQAAAARQQGLAEAERIEQAAAKSYSEANQSLERLRQRLRREISK